MPYINKADRSQFSKILKDLPAFKTKGELEFCIFYLMKLYMSKRPYKYTDLHDTVYAAAHCSDEFRRLYLDAREDIAMFQNGDIELEGATKID